MFLHFLIRNSGKGMVCVRECVHCAVSAPPFDVHTTPAATNLK
ncbi:hypothetical protein K788_0002540 [Paraburkholderia caribensis MBA4]|uniref:Uncharacterized protein n=1 Tax=Paraburkholderia caribensis MBA4 TaxID=1323664 RepID=A0A0P0RAH5_9BURK|nr:hypothetical protein K788_0002540 [Paraburkholderia caribensis MBA4]